MYMGSEEEGKKGVKEVEKLKKEWEGDGKNKGGLREVYEKGWERMGEVWKEKEGVVGIGV